MGNWLQQLTWHLRRLAIWLVRPQHIYLLACPCSGATALGRLLAKFSDTMLLDETPGFQRYPSLRACSVILWRRLVNRRPYYVITRSPKNWWASAQLPEVEAAIRRKQALVVHFIRDPRDVLTIVDVRNRKDFFVTPALWSRCVAAAQMLLRSLSDYPNKMTIRYEDIVQHPEAVAQLFRERLGMTLPDDKAPSDTVPQTVPLVIPANSSTLDRPRVGHWRADSDKFRYVNSLLEGSEFHGELVQYMTNYGFFELVSERIAPPHSGVNPTT